MRRATFAAMLIHLPKKMMKKEAMKVRNMTTHKMKMIMVNSGHGMIIIIHMDITGSKKIIRARNPITIKTVGQHAILLLPISGLLPKGAVTIP